jgi:ribonuclease BN (tRNA processing enzyme)
MIWLPVYPDQDQGIVKYLITKYTAFLLALFLGAMAAVPQAQERQGGRSTVVLLGTGNPKPDPDRSGPATAIVVNGSAYLIDFGPGVVRRAAAAVIDKGVAALEPTQLRVVFVTHLHSDHTAGYPDLILTPWVMGRRVPLEVYGPKGIKAMTDHVLAAYTEDIRIRTEGMEHAAKDGCKVNVHEIKPGMVYKDANVTVTAFPTKHGEWEETFGYRFDTPDRSIVITGDTTPVQATIDACRGCDVLIHEAIPSRSLVNPIRSDSQGFDRKAYADRYHTTTTQLAELAAKAKPGLLILYHTAVSLRPGKRPLAPTPDDLLREIKSGYGGKAVVGRDLDIY